MPEGPSLVILRELTVDFIGQTVKSVSGNSRLEIQVLKGQKLNDIRTWGKHFLMVFEDYTVRIHFMLWGSYRINERKENSNPRLSLVFGNGELNFYACSVRFIEEDINRVYDWSADVMSDTWNPKKARKKLKEKPDMLVADALLDQQIFSGVGNIIKNEVLWRIRIHPESRIGALPPRKLTQLINEARNYSFDFYNWKKVYQLKKNYKVHTKKTCPDCGGKLTKKHIGKTNRRTFYCENCQVLYH